eukprot:5341858-Pleurochrysis_carterae.AAC.1
MAQICQSPTTRLSPPVAIVANARGHVKPMAWMPSYAPRACTTFCCTLCAMPRNICCLSERGAG